ncbi:MAG: Rpn family recombination-promoting nuclease/putative transposase [Ruminococcus sp.]|nr:Rpn family recombination-promoting nuclease/putative transposase [Ruminococcus sp.]
MNEIKILPAYDDGVFKAIFTKPESKVALLDIIRAFTGIPVIDAEVKNNERSIENVGDKHIRFDINCKTSDGKLIDIEMQASSMSGDSINNAHEAIRERSVYYEAMLHSSQERPRLYKDQVQSIQLMICNYTVFPDDNILRRFYFTDETGNILSKSMCIIFAELTKIDVNKPIHDMTDLEEWAFYLRYSNNPKYQKAIETLRGEKEAFRMAYNTQIHVSQDEKAQAYYMSRLKYELDEQNRINTWEREKQETFRKALDLGRNEGRNEGIKTEKFTTAYEMLSDGVPIIKITKYTGLTESEIESLKNNPPKQ